MDYDYVNECVIRNTTVENNQCKFSVYFQNEKWRDVISNTPYFDHNFNSVSHNFSISWQYFEGVLFWPTIILLALFMTIVCLIVYSCCLCYFVKRSQNKEFTIWNRRPWVSLILLCIFYLIGIIISSVSLWPDISIIDALYNVIDLSQKTNTFINQIKSDVNSLPLEAINTTLFRISDELTSLKFNSSNSSSVIIRVNEFKNIINYISKDVDTIYLIFNKISFEQILSKSTFLILFWSIFKIIINSITAILCLIGVVYTIIHMRPFLGYILLIGTFGFLIGWWVLATTGLIATLALTDLCTFPNPDILIRSHIASTPEYKNYFLYCKGCNNPFSSINQTFNKNLIDLQAGIWEIVDFSEMSSPTLYNTSLSLSSFVNKSISITEQLFKQDLNCNITSGLYSSSISQTCDKGIKWFTVELLCSTLITLLFTITTPIQCYATFRMFTFQRKSKKTKFELNEWAALKTEAESQVSISQSITRVPSFQRNSERLGYIRHIEGEEIQQREELIIPEFIESSSSRTARQIDSFPLTYRSERTMKESLEYYIPSIYDWLYRSTPSQRIVHISNTI